MSDGLYTGVAPGSNLIGIGTGDVLFIFWALAGFDYILQNQDRYNNQGGEQLLAARAGPSILRIPSASPASGCTIAASRWCSRPGMTDQTRTR